MMTYSQSLRYLEGFLNYERILHLQKNRAWNLRRMEILLEWFGHPEKKFFPVLIAGTKGKGSTGYFLESVLRESGISVGFYSSPHLERPTERIRVRGREISRTAWARGLSEIRRVLRRKSLPARFGEFTYFEILTLLAIREFSARGLRVGLFEVGLGGRLDATNVLCAPVAVLTPISLDHESILGPTLGRIAAEKAGIIHRKADVVIGPQPQEAWRVLLGAVRRTGSRLWRASPYHRSEVGLTGRCQTVNAGLAVKAAEVLRKQWGFRIPDAVVRTGLLAGDWPGRWEAIGRGPDFYIDAAHNLASVLQLTHRIRERRVPRRSLLLFGTSRDKNAAAMLRILRAGFSDVILVQAKTMRAKEVQDLALLAREGFKKVILAGSSEEALHLARHLRSSYDEIVATGSFYLIGELRTLVKRPGGW